jgi:hypothetical protein
MSEVSRSLHFWKGRAADLRLLAAKQNVAGRTLAGHPARARTDGQRVNAKQPALSL